MISALYSFCFVKLSTDVIINNFTAHHPPDILLDLFCTKETSKYIYLKFKTYFIVYVVFELLLASFANILPDLIDKDSIWLPILLEFPYHVVCLLFILFFNQSILKELIFNFEILYCIFNIFVFTLTDLMMKIREINFELAPILGYIFLICIPRFIFYSSVFFFDCLSFDILPLRYRQYMYGVSTISIIFMFCFYSYFPREGNFTFTIFSDYGINMQQQYAASILSVVIFTARVCVYSIISPEKYVMHSTFLCRK